MGRRNDRNFAFFDHFPLLIPLSGLDDLHNEQSLRNDHLLTEPWSSSNGSNWQSRRKSDEPPYLLLLISSFVSPQHFRSVEFHVRSSFAAISQQFANFFARFIDRTMPRKLEYKRNRSRAKLLLGRMPSSPSERLTGLTPTSGSGYGA